MTCEIINLSERRATRSVSRRGRVQAVWPLVIIACLTFWTWFAFVVTHLAPLFGARWS
jgi:hypothetical protein